MPEGDTIHKVARVMAQGLVGHELVEVWTRPHGMVAALQQKKVRNVSAVGKHLVLESDGGALRVHLGMRGSWHGYSHGVAWSKPRSAATVRIATRDYLYVCFNGHRIEWAPSANRLRGFATIGPDLLGHDVSFDEILERARIIAPRQTIADLLLDQRAACGVGNVYKNEILFIEGIHPWTLASDLSDATLRRCFETGERLLKKNVRHGPRVTVDPAHRTGLHAAKHYVYERAGRPCLRCGTRIACRRQGSQARLTFWCARCQPRKIIG